MLKGAIKVKNNETDKGKGESGGLFGGAVMENGPHKSEISKETKWEKLVLIEAWDDKVGEKDAYIDLEQFFS